MALQHTFECLWGFQNRVPRKMIVMSVSRRARPRELLHLARGERPFRSRGCLPEGLRDRFVRLRLKMLAVTENKMQKGVTAKEKCPWFYHAAAGTVEYSGVHGIRVRVPAFTFAGFYEILLTNVSSWKSVRPES